MERTSGLISSCNNSLDTPLSANTANLLTYHQQDRALKSLARAISLSPQRFSLLMVRGNSSLSSALQTLKEQYSVEPQILHLPETSRSLFAAIQPMAQPSQGLMVLGLEAIIELDKFLITTNQMRNQMRNTFHFPIVLWVDDQIFCKLVKLAPDFYSWVSTPINLK